MKPDEDKTNLKEVYNRIADSWSNLRAQPKDYVVEISKNMKGGNVLDLGCGNCRNLIPFLERKNKGVGLDYSKSMIKEAKKLLGKKKLKASLIIADVTSLPFKSSVFGVILYLASLHHVPTRKLRTDSLKEVERVSSKEVKSYISVWNRMQIKFLWELFLSLFRKKHEFGDIYKPWNYHGQVLYRFYHLYTKPELKNDLMKVGFKIDEITDVAYREKSNILAKVSK